MHGTRLYEIWNGARGRCRNKANKNYGGRGITFHPGWLKFETFRDWALANGYVEGLSIDRIDVDGNYEPSNCRWVTRLEQARNRRATRFLPDGRPALAVARSNGINPVTFRVRIFHGWSLERAATTPTMGRNKQGAQ